MISPEEGLLIYLTPAGPSIWDLKLPSSPSKGILLIEFGEIGGTWCLGEYTFGAGHGMQSTTLV